MSPEDQAFYQSLKSVEQQCLNLIQTRWGLAPPTHLQVDVFTNWQDLIFTDAPLHWRLFLRATQPLWRKRMEALVTYAGGWTQRYGKHTVIAIKPPNLLKKAERTAGRQLFIDLSPADKTAFILCHELTHACSAHLRLPLWLNEGLAMLTVDAFLNRPTVRASTLELFQNTAKANPTNYRKLNLANTNQVVYDYARGYWLVRYLDEKHKRLLHQFLAKRHTNRQINIALGGVFSITPKQFWQEVDQRLLAHFQLTFPSTPSALQEHTMRVF